MIEFANPAMLWGTALAAIPLLVHLFNRKRARPHAFAAIDFVLRSRRRTARRLRLRRLLLFVARTLLLLAVPLALARPQPKRAAAIAAPTGPAATAIVLDTSLSMSYQLDGRSLLERAREMAREALANLAPEDPVTLVTCEAEAKAPPAPGFDRGRVRQAIDAAPQTSAPQELTPCLARAAAALGESTIPAKRIVLATDLTASGFRLDVPAPTVATAAGEVRPEVVLLDAAGGKALPNAAIVALKVEPALAIGNRAFQFSLTAANHSPSPLKDLRVNLRVGPDVVAKGFLEVPARGSAVKTLTHRFPAGGHYTGSVEIASDALAADDVRSFAIRVPRDVKALVVDGAPHAVRLLDEAFFVQTALEAPGSPVRPTLRDADTALGEKLADYDVVMLLNVHQLPAAKVQELREFVQRGGGLFASLGDQVDPDVANAGLGDLLPRPLHLVKTAADRKEPESDRKAARLTQVEWGHPALSVFTGDAREGVLSARTYRYFLLAPGAPGQIATLASFDDGAPALLEAQRGRGRVVLYTSSVDRDWSDWPIRTSFLPVVQRLAGWLAGALDEREVAASRVGEPRVLAIPEGAQSVRIVRPDGKDEAPEAGPDGKPVFRRTEQPGIYLARGKVNGASGPIDELQFAVNVDPRESDLARLEERELKAYFGEKTRTERVGGGREEAPQSFPLWTVLLVAAVGLFASEAALGRK